MYFWLNILRLSACLQGPILPSPPWDPMVIICAAYFDRDGDIDVDLMDLAELQLEWNDE